MVAKVILISHYYVHRYNISTADYEAWGEQGVNSSIERQTARVFNGANGIVNRQISNITSVYEKYFNYETAAQVCVYVRE